MEKYVASKGKVWYSLKLKMYLSNVLILTSEDNIENYEERVPPKESDE